MPQLPREMGAIGGGPPPPMGGCFPGDGMDLPSPMGGFGQMPPLQDLYGKVPRGPSLGPRPGMEEMEFSDEDDRTPLTEPIYNGR